jgi:cytoskeletal protein RodZ
MTDLFFQPLDQARMQACVNGVAREGMCVVVHCPQTALLNYYGQIFLNHLHEAMPSGTIESYSPSDSDVLIENFNQMVSEMSVQEALKPGNLSEVSKVWVIKNAQNMEAHELDLLGQLLQQFPGSKIRFILWTAGNEPSVSLLNVLGKKMMRWNIALPDSTQTQTFWNQARATKQEEDVRPMLDQLRLMEHIPAALRSVRASKSAAATKAKKKFKFTTPKIAVAFLVGMALLTGSTVFVAWLNPEAFAWLKLDAESAKAKPNNQNERSEPAATETKAETTTAEAAQEPQPIQPPQATQSAESLPSKLPQEVRSEVSKADDSAVELPDEALEGSKWAEQLPPQRWLVLHGAYKSFSIAKQVKKAYPGLKNSRVVPVYKPNEPLASFVLASGPFEALQSAEEFTKLSTLPSPGTVRTERNLKSRLTPVARP